MDISLKKESMENNNSKIAIAIVAGVAAGATAWYLMSTENGKHSWTTLLDVIKDVSDKLISASNESGSFLSLAGKDASEYIGHKAHDILEDVKKYS